jgi:hypothetical protein
MKREQRANRLITHIENQIYEPVLGQRPQANSQKSAVSVLLTIGHLNTLKMSGRLT